MLKTEEKVDALIKLLSHDDIEVRQNAIWELGKMGKGAKKAVKILINLLEEGEEINYYLITNALQKIGKETSEIFPELIEAFNDIFSKSYSGIERVLEGIARDSKLTKELAIALIQGKCVCILRKRILRDKIDDPQLQKSIDKIVKDYYKHLRDLD